MGEKRYALLKKLAGERRVDLLWHLPLSLTQRTPIARLSDAYNGQEVIVTGRVVAHQPPRHRQGRSPYRVQLDVAGAPLTVLFFHARGDHVPRLLPMGEARVLVGKLEHRYGEAVMIHPSPILPVAAASDVPRVDVHYPLTAGLTHSVLRLAIHTILESLPPIPEWLDDSVLRQRGWPSWVEALRLAHQPQTLHDLSPTCPARLRLAYDEVLAHQLSLALTYQQKKSVEGMAMQGTGILRERLLTSLPFTLTPAQTRCVAEISADMAAPTRMVRLLQGDVGSGKTIVAFLAALHAIEAGFQAAIMAPTDILARQHQVSMGVWADAVGIRLGYLSGRVKGKERTALLNALEAGDIDLLVGTHALFQDEVRFARLGVAIIDEQHRFGVHQRLALARKGAATDMLVMTATPIPRTLVLTLYHGMQVSRLDEKPAGRQPITTIALPMPKLPELLQRLEHALASGQRAYWVCPLVDTSEVLDLAAATDRFVALCQRFGKQRVGLVHGQMPVEEKDAVMDAFAAGTVQILVATTVIEVGVNVPEATIIVIDNAQRFGLAQLHQLRGRVGRGVGASSCVLLYPPPLQGVAKERLNLLRQTEDGFLLAEEDLRLRGAGDVLGAKQSGAPAFRLADIDVHADLLRVAQLDAQAFLANDPTLTSPRGQALRLLLKLFQYDDVLGLLRSG